MPIATGPGCFAVIALVLGMGNMKKAVLYRRAKGIADMLCAYMIVTGIAFPALQGSPSCRLTWQDRMCSRNSRALGERR